MVKPIREDHHSRDNRPMRAITARRSTCTNRDVYDLFEQIEDDILDQVRTLVQGRLLAGDTLDFQPSYGHDFGARPAF